MHFSNNFLYQRLNACIDADFKMRLEGQSTSFRKLQLRALTFNFVSIDSVRSLAMNWLNGGAVLKCIAALQLTRQIWAISGIPLA